MIARNIHQLILANHSFTKAKFTIARPKPESLVLKNNKLNVTMTRAKFKVYNH